MDYKILYSLLNESSQRTRSVLYVMLLTSILMFVPYWNVRPDNWLNSRIEIRQKIMKWYGWDSDVKKKIKKNSDSKDFVSSKQAGELFGFDFENLQKDSISNIARLQTEILELRKINIAKSFITIPIFNVTVDINDLSLFGGFAFVVILSILRASVYREVLNLTFIFEEAEKQEELLKAYQILGMSQVLTVPREKKTYELFAILLTVIYLFLPLFVQGYTFVYDINRIEYALVQNESATVIHMLLNSIWLVITSILTFSCLQLSIKYNKKWQEVSIKLKNSPSIPKSLEPKPTLDNFE